MTAHTDGGRRARFFSRIRAGISYANVTSTLALFLALGGGVYAATKVGSPQIRNNSVLSKDLKNRKAVKGKDVKDGSLRGADVADGSLTGADLAADEAPHIIGAPGEPTLGNGGDGDCLWQESRGPGFNPLSFYRGKDGRVHLAGLPAAQNGLGGCGPELEDSRIFTLPPTYRPANVESFTSGAPDGTVPVGVVIGADQDTQVEGLGIPAGAVLVNPFSPSDAPQGVGLDGIDFRAAGTGGFG
jgi:hypothetical protein